MSHESTVQVRRGGTYLTIAATSVERYIAKGFDIVDNDGNVIRESVPNDVNALRKAFEDHVAKIKSLEAEISQLKDQLKQSAEVTDKPVRKSTKKSV